MNIHEGKGFCVSDKYQNLACRQIYFFILVSVHGLPFSFLSLLASCYNELPWQCLLQAQDLMC